MESRSVFRSQKNIYHLFSDRIVVRSGSAVKEILLPADPATYMYYLEFTYMFYEGEKLYVVTATRGPFDIRFEIDEDTLELKGPPVPIY